MTYKHPSQRTTLKDHPWQVRTPQGHVVGHFRTSSHARTIAQYTEGSVVVFVG